MLFLLALNDEGEILLMQLRIDRFQLDIVCSSNFLCPQVSGKDLTPFVHLYLSKI